MDAEAIDSRADTLAHIADVQDLLAYMTFQLTRRAMEHDRSKLKPPEVDAFDRAPSTFAQTEYGTPEYETARASLGRALAHHYEHNRHHPEHFRDGVADMNLIDVVEMCCDWIAASKRHDGFDVRRSFYRSVERFGIEPQLASILANTMILLQDEV